MVSTHENKRDIKTNRLRQLLLQTNTRIIENDLSTKSITQKEKKMKMKTKERKKLSVNNKKYIEKK